MPQTILPFSLKIKLALSIRHAPPTQRPIFEISFIYAPSFILVNPNSMQFPQFPLPKFPLSSAGGKYSLPMIKPMKPFSFIHRTIRIKTNTFPMSFSRLHLSNVELLAHSVKIMRDQNNLFIKNTLPKSKVLLKPFYLNFLSLHCLRDNACPLKPVFIFFAYFQILNLIVLRKMILLTNYCMFICFNILSEKKLWFYCDGFELQVGHRIFCSAHCYPSHDRIPIKKVSTIHQYRVLHQLKRNRTNVSLWVF